MKEITIADPSKLTVHPAAALFPMTDDKEVEELAADMKTNGQRVPCVVLLGELLDGRRRLAACRIAGITPRFVEWDGTGSPTSWIFSVNLHRRHLTPSQRAMLAVRAIEIFEREAKERQEGGVATDAAARSRTKAAETVGIGEATVARAQQVIAKGTPELVAAIEAGEVPVATATQIVSLPPEEQRTIVREKKVVERAREEREKRRPPRPPAHAVAPPLPPIAPPSASHSLPDNDNDGDEDPREDADEEEEESTLDPRNRPEAQPINVSAFKVDYRKGSKPKDEAPKVDQILAAARSALYTWRWIAIEWSEDKRWDMKFALHDSGQIAHHLQQAVAKLEEISAICNGQKPAPPSERP